MTLSKWNFLRVKKYKLSNKAATDLVAISHYLQKEFGEQQAKAYLTGLKEILLQLSNNPALGQNVTDIRPNYRRYLFQKHAIYFYEIDYGIRVVRILHQQMKISFHIR